jgi:hypothetical protein
MAWARERVDGREGAAEAKKEGIAERQNGSRARQEANQMRWCG